MKKNEKNEELQSRREFFKKAAKGALPILGTAIITTAPLKIFASESGSNSCNWSCEASCSGGCMGCTGSCTGGCQSSCTNSCVGGCRITCSANCRSQSNF